MFNLHDGLKYYLCQFPVSMNKGIRGLSNYIMANVPVDVLSGSVFIFFSANRKAVKILRWDGDGFLLYHKVLQKGTFEIPTYCADTGSYELSYDTVSFLMRGVALDTIKLRKRFQYNPNAM